MEPWLVIVLCVAALIVGAAVSGLIMFKMGIEHRRKTAEAQIESAEKEAARILAESKEKASTAKKLRSSGATPSTS